MRKIDYIVVHCTGTTADAKVASIQKYWKDNLGWSNPGYHYLIDRFGVVHNLQDESKPSNGVKGYNANSVHVSYIGGVQQGVTIDTRTPEQKTALINIITKLKQKYPDAVIQGHRDFAFVKKSCPCFNAKTEYFYIK